MDTTFGEAYNGMNVTEKVNADGRTRNVTFTIDRQYFKDNNYDMSSKLSLKLFLSYVVKELKNQNESGFKNPSDTVNADNFLNHSVIDSHFDITKFTLFKNIFEDESNPKPGIITFYYKTVRNGNTVERPFRLHGILTSYFYHTLKKYYSNNQQNLIDGGKKNTNTLNQTDNDLVNSLQVLMKDHPAVGEIVKTFVNSLLNVLKSEDIKKEVMKSKGVAIAWPEENATPGSEYPADLNLVISDTIESNPITSEKPNNADISPDSTKSE